MTATLPLAEGVDPAWIDEQPPPLTNRAKPDPALIERRRSARDWSGNELDLYRQWNARWAELDGCVADGFLRDFPSPSFIFDPPDGDKHPVYRFLLARTLPTGLVTNRFGWRGEEIPLDKPQNTVRLAFVGASTTVGQHRFAFSYPEYVVHWLNLWAARHDLDVRFDGINAGREGVGSSDIAAIVRGEILPAEPDLVVYYEGSNQFELSDLIDIPVSGLLYPEADERGALLRALYIVRDFSALARRLADLSFVIAENRGVEPNKPSYTLEWPSNVDEQNPDLTAADLPVSLPVILRDLESIRRTLENEGAELALGSFVWFVHDGMRVDPLQHPFVTRFYRVRYWPYRYADIRRLADFQNRVLQRFAITRGVQLIDLARLFPQDLDFFIDGIHFNRAGVRLQAWIVMQTLIPQIRERLSAGDWPRPDRQSLTRHPFIDPPRVVPDVCTPTAQNSSPRMERESD